MKLGILKDLSNTSKYYIDACEDLGIEYEVINIMSSNWLEIIQKSFCNGFLVAPYSVKDVWKNMYIERLYFINKTLGYPIYPSYDEVFIYESKRNMSYWLQAHDIKSPKTWIFYDKYEALNFVNNTKIYPLVFKPNIGSAALGIKIIKDKKTAIQLIDRIFTKWKFFNRGFTKWNKTKYKLSYPIMDDKQYNNILFQEMINVKHEWRGIKIGNSYFAHKKLANSDGFHSGSGLASYETPPLEVLDFIRFVCDKGEFRSMNVDFFEDIYGNFFVNELQTIFGSKIKPYQMCVNGEPGRYLYDNDRWVFQKGMFNQNNSYNLRVMDFISILDDE